MSLDRQKGGGPKSVQIIQEQGGAYGLKARFVASNNKIEVRFFVCARQERGETTRKARGGKSKKGAMREAKGSRGRTRERERLVEKRRS